MLAFFRRGRPGPPGTRRGGKGSRGAEGANARRCISVSNGQRAKDTAAPTTPKATGIPEGPQRSLPLGAAGPDTPLPTVPRPRRARPETPGGRSRWPVAENRGSLPSDHGPPLSTCPCLVDGGAWNPGRTHPPPTVSRGSAGPPVRSTSPRRASLRNRVEATPRSPTAGVWGGSGAATPMP